MGGGGGGGGGGGVVGWGGGVGVGGWGGGGGGGGRGWGGERGGLGAMGRRSRCSYLLCVDGPAHASKISYKALNLKNMVLLHQSNAKSLCFEFTWSRRLI